MRIQTKVWVLSIVSMIHCCIKNYCQHSCIRYHTFIRGSTGSVHQEFRNHLTGFSAPESFASCNQKLNWESISSNLSDLVVKFSLARAVGLEVYVYHCLVNGVYMSYLAWQLALSASPGRRQ